MKKSESIPIRAQGRVIGRVVGKVFFKGVKGSVHFLRTPPAIAFDVESLKTARKHGATLVQVNDVETNRRYLTPMLTIFERGFWLDRGCGEQIALEMKYWTGTQPVLQGKFL